MRDFFLDDNGTASSMRLMSFVSLLISAVCVVGIFILLFFDVLIPEETYWLTGVFVVFAMAPKTVQKYIEKRFIGGGE